MIQLIQYSTDLFQKVSISYSLLPFLKVIEPNCEQEIKANGNHQIDFSFKKLLHKALCFLLRILTLKPSPLSQYPPALFENINRILKLLGQFASQQNGRAGMNKPIESVVTDDFDM